MQGRKDVAKRREKEVDVLVRRHEEEAGAQAWMRGCQTSPLSLRQRLAPL